MKALIYISESFNDIQKVYATFLNLMKRGFTVVAVDNKGIQAAKMAGIAWVRSLPVEEIGMTLAFVSDMKEFPLHITKGLVWVEGAWKEITAPLSPQGSFQCNDCDQYFENRLNFIPKLCPTCYRYSKLSPEEQWNEGPPTKFFGLYPRYFRPEIVDEYKDPETGEDIQVIGDWSEEDNQVYLQLIDGEAGYDGFNEDDPDLDFQREINEILPDLSEEQTENFASAMNERWHN